MGQPSGLTGAAARLCRGVARSSTEGEPVVAATPVPPPSIGATSIAATSANDEVSAGDTSPAAVDRPADCSSLSSGLAPPSRRARRPLSMYFMPRPSSHICPLIKFSGPQHHPSRRRPPPASRGRGAGPPGTTGRPRAEPRSERRSSDHGRRTVTVCDVLP